LPGKPIAAVVAGHVNVAHVTALITGCRNDKLLCVLLAPAAVEQI